MQVDERNLIDAEDSDEISFEDRIHMYWMDNKAFISGCITLLALIIIGINGMRMYVSYAESKIQAAYAEAMANDSLEAFANDYYNKPLGGLAALDVADVYYSGGDFGNAIEYYNIAIAALENDILNGRARLGLAFAIFYNGDQESGIAQLKTIAADSSLPGAIRAEAAYHLAVDADVAGDDAAFESYAAQVSNNPMAAQWQQRMQTYQMRR